MDLETQPSADSNLNTLVVISGLNRETREQSLCALFEAYATFISIELERDKHGRSRGIGNVIFSTFAGAKTAIGHLENVRLDGRDLRFRIARDVPNNLVASEQHDGWTEIRRREGSDA